LLLFAVLSVNADFTGFSLQTNVTEGYDTVYNIGYIGDINGDGFEEIVVVGDDYAVYVIHGSATVLDTDLIHFKTQAQLKINFTVAYNFGYYAIRPMGDIDQDGYGDFFITGYYGISVLIYGGANLPALIDASIMTTEGTRIHWGYDSDAMYPGGPLDINKDGFADLSLACPENDTVVVVFGTGARFPSDLYVSTLTPSEAFYFNGPAGSDAGHWIASVGDTNGDGYDDLLISMHYYQNLGGAYLIYGRSSFTDINFDSRSPADGVFFYHQNPDLDDLGHSVAAAGDFNNDGLADFVITNPHISDTSPPNKVTSAVLYFGSRSIPSTVDVYNMPSGAGIVYYSGKGEYDEFGELYSQAVGDFNKDGYSDLVMGAYDRDIGHVLILLGGASHPDRIDTTVASPYVYDFQAIGQGFGYVLAVQDYNKDGLPDLHVFTYDTYESYIFHNIPVSPSSSLSPAASASGSPVRIPEYYEVFVLM